MRFRAEKFFRRMFEDSPWAAEYGEAANTQQLLEMGGSNLGTVVEDDQVRVELLDAVSTGESAMAAVRITILDTDLLQRTFGENSVSYGRFLLVDGSFFLTNSSQTEIRDSEMDETLADNQLLMIFRSDGNAVGENRQCTITLHDFGYYQYDSEDDREGEKVVLIPGEWTLGMNLSFDGGICYEPNETYTLRGCQIQVESVCVTTLTTPDGHPLPDGGRRDADGGLPGRKDLPCRRHPAGLFRLFLWRTGRRRDGFFL